MDIILSATVINTFGLMLDIVGAILIWKFGLPEEISKSGAVHLVLTQDDPEEKAKAAFYDKWGKAGISCLIIGFLLQAISNFIK